MSKVTVDAPPVNIYESSGQLTVAVALPGAHQDTVKVALVGRRLSIEAEPRYPREQQHYLQHEWSVGAMHREVELPKPVQPSGAKATLTHGVLMVSLPIGEERASGRVPIPVTEPTSHQSQAR